MIIIATGRMLEFINYKLFSYMEMMCFVFKEGFVVRHLDGNTFNNSKSNIAIGTLTDNQMDISKEIRIHRANTGAAFVRKFDFNTVCNIRKDRMSSMSYRELMKKYSIKKSTLSYIVNRKTYQTVTG
jgi:hypothetical protein